MAFPGCSDAIFVGVVGNHSVNDQSDIDRLDRGQERGEAGLLRLDERIRGVELGLTAHITKCSAESRYNRWILVVGLAVSYLISGLSDGEKEKILEMVSRVFR